MVQAVGDLCTAVRKSEPDSIHDDVALAQLPTQRKCFTNAFQALMRGQQDSCPTLLPGSLTSRSRFKDLLRFRAYHFHRGLRFGPSPTGALAGAWHAFGAGAEMAAR